MSRPMFQRRHHRVIAQILGRADTWAEVAEGLVLLFQNDNPGFNREVFRIIVTEPEMELTQRGQDDAGDDDGKSVDR